MVNGVAKAGDDAEIFFAVESEIFSEPEPIASSADSWGDEFTGGERQWVLALLEAGLRYRNWELSVQQRALADMRFNEDATRFYGRISRDENLEPDEQAPVQLSFETFTAQGLRLGYGRKGSGWQWRGGVTLLQADRLMSGRLDGEFAATAPNDYDFNAAVNYYYFKDPLFDRPNVVEPSGVGWSFDWQSSVQINEYWRLRASVDDLFAKIRWTDAPFTQAQALTDRKRYDAEGYAIFDPFLSGEEGYQEVYHQQLEPRYRVESEWTVGTFSAHLQGRKQFGYSRAGVGAGFQLSPNYAFSALVWPRTGSVSVNLDLGAFTAGIAIDAVMPDELKYFSVNLAYNRL